MAFYFAAKAGYILFSYLYCSSNQKKGLLYLFTLFLALDLNLYLQLWTTVAQLVHDVLKEYPHLRLTHGRKVFFRANILPEQYSLFFIEYFLLYYVELFL
jgi:hypothetical protein